MCYAELFEWLFSYLVTPDEPGGKSIYEEALLTRVRHSDEPGNNETDRWRETERETDGLRKVASCGCGDRTQTEKDLTAAPPIGTASTVINHVWTKKKMAISSSSDLGRSRQYHKTFPSPLSSSLPRYLQDSHTEKLTLNDTAVFRNTRKEKKNCLSLKTCCKTSALLFRKAMQCEDISAGG